MRRSLLSAIALFASAHLLIATPAAADYAAAEAALQAGNVSGAIPLLAEEAKLGNPVAAFNLGKIYEDGAVGAPDFAQAATYYRIAAEIDTAPRYNGAALGAQGPQLISAAQMYGQYALGELYEAGKGVPQDYNEAVGWYTRAADLGSIKAMLKLAVVQREGLPGIPPDLASSTSWLQRAAEQGSIPGALELGRAYQAGVGVAPNAQEAAKWFGQALAGGAISAEYNMGMLYKNGLGGQPDFVRAVEHFERGANAKDARAMLALGDLYANGEGVPADKIQAHAWYSLATDNGAAEGSAKAAALAQGMTQQELASAITLHDNWRPKNQDTAPTSEPIAAPASVPPASSPAETPTITPALDAGAAPTDIPPAATPAPDLPPLFDDQPAAPAPTPIPAPAQTTPAEQPILLDTGLGTSETTLIPSTATDTPTDQAVPPASQPLPKSTPATLPLDPTAPVLPGGAQPGAKPFSPSH